MASATELSSAATGGNVDPDVLMEIGQSLGESSAAVVTELVGAIRSFGLLWLDDGSQEIRSSADRLEALAGNLGLAAVELAQWLERSSREESYR